MQKPIIVYRRLESVCSKTGLKRSTIYKRVGEGTFPPPIRLGSSRTVGWLDSEISAIAEAWASGIDGHGLKRIVQSVVRQRPVQGVKS